MVLQMDTNTLAHLIGFKMVYTSVIVYIKL